MTLVKLLHHNSYVLPEATLSENQIKINKNKRPRMKNQSGNRLEGYLGTSAHASELWEPTASKVVIAWRWIGVGSVYPASAMFFIKYFLHRYLPSDEGKNLQDCIMTSSDFTSGQTHKTWSTNTLLTITFLPFYMNTFQRKWIGTPYSVEGKTTYLYTGRKLTNVGTTLFSGWHIKKT